MTKNYLEKSKNFSKQIADVMARNFGIKPEDATKSQIYRATCMVIRDILTSTRIDFKKTVREKNAKQVYYMSMEFLLGRSLKNHLFNMGITDVVEKAVGELGMSLDELYEFEPDAGLGNGGL